MSDALDDCCSAYIRPERNGLEIEVDNGDVKLCNCVNCGLIGTVLVFGLMQFLCLKFWRVMTNNNNDNNNNYIWKCLYY